MHQRVVHIISIVGVCPIDIHRRVVHIISIVGVSPIDIHRRVVHKIDYRSLSTIYIGGLSMVKNKYLCFEMVFSYMAQESVRESVRTQDMGWSFRHSSRITNLLECVFTLEHCICT